MTFSSLLSTAWRQTHRDLRGGELNLLLVALVLAVTVSTAIGLFGDRLQKGLGRQVAAVLGADLIVQGSRPVDTVIDQKASETGLMHSRTIEFPSVILAGDELQMISAKGVETGYPLRGQVRIADQPFGPDQVTNTIPAPGEAWLEPRLFPLLNISIGDTVTLGEKELRITRAITLESDRGKGFYSFSPRLLFNLADLDDTNLIQPGSRVAWRNLYAGPESALKPFRGWLADNLPKDYRLLDLEDNSRRLNRSLTRVTGFLALASQLAVLLAGIAIAMAARRFARRRYDTVAVLRCLGARRSDILTMAILQLFLILPVAIPPALLLGWLLSEGTVLLLKDLLPAWLPAAGITPILMGAATGIIVLLGFALAPLLRLGDITPLRVLKREPAPAPASAWIVYSLALISLVSLSWYMTGNLSLTLSLTLGAAAILPLTGLLLSFILRVFSRSFNQRQVTLVWRMAMRRLTRQQSLALAQLLAFSLTLMVMAVAMQVRTDLLNQWQDQLPDDAPNYFSLNIQTTDVGPLAAFMEEREISTSQMYPIIRGRLTAINGQPLNEILDKEQQRHNAVNRELNITWSDTLPETNTLISGDWWSPGEEGEASVESHLAEHLDLSVGDTLSFNFAGRPLTVDVTSLRKVEWENFRPNFYIVMPKATLEDYPATWLNSFHLPQEQRRQLNDMIRSFPSLTLIDMDTVINQARQMIQQGILALEAMLVVLFLAGLLVLWASIETTLVERIKESALLRALGTQGRQLQRLQMGEFLLLGSLSGLLAAIGAELCTWLVFTRVLELSWTPTPLLWLLLPLSGAILIGAAGYLGTLRVVRTSPLRLLREGL